MQAPKVQNQNAITPSPAPNAKQSAPDVPFNQMLTQQIADRSNVSETGKSSEPTPPAATNKVNDANKSNDSNKANDSSQAASDTSSTTKQTAPNAADSTDTADSKLGIKDKIKGVDDSLRADLNAPVSPSAELMALVASQMNQANAKSADTSAAAPVAANDGLAQKIDTRSTLATDRTLTNLKDSFSQQADIKTPADKMQSAELTGKDANLKPNAAFAATMSALEQTADSKQALQLASAKLQDALPATATGATPQLQQTALNLAQTVAGHPTDKLTPQVGSPAWDQALGQKVVWMVAGAQQSASLTLNPPDLGPMQVVLNVSNGHADATFTANQPEVRQALEAALPKLREMMSDAGIQLGQATISAGMPNQQNRSGEQTGQKSRGVGQPGETLEPIASVSSSRKTIGGQGLVDTFA